MIIIVEGIDRVGKTTLCNIISKKLNIPIYKKERTADVTNLSPYEKVLVNFGNASGIIDCWNSEWCHTNILVDRFYWTEYVYSKVERYSNIPLSFNSFIEDQMLKSKDEYVIVYVEPVDILYSSQQHGSDMSRHFDIFNTLYDKCQLPKIKVNYHTLYEAVQFVEERMNERQ